MVDIWKSLARTSDAYTMGQLISALIGGSALMTVLFGALRSLSDLPGPLLLAVAAFVVMCLSVVALAAVVGIARWRGHDTIGSPKAGLGRHPIPTPSRAAAGGAVEWLGMYSGRMLFRVGASAPHGVELEAYQYYQRSEAHWPQLDHYLASVTKEFVTLVDLIAAVDPKEALRLEVSALLNEGAELATRWDDPRIYPGLGDLAEAWDPLAPVDLATGAHAHLEHVAELESACANWVERVRAVLHEKRRHAEGLFMECRTEKDPKERLGCYREKLRKIYEQI